MLFPKSGKTKTANKAKKYTVCYCRPFKYIMTNLTVKKVKEQCPPQTSVSDSEVKKHWTMQTEVYTAAQFYSRHLNITFYDAYSGVNKEAHGV